MLVLPILIVLGLIAFLYVGVVIVRMVLRW